MVSVRIKDLTPSASTYADGEIVYNFIRDKIVGGEEVVVSFDEIVATPSAFVNSAFVRLLEVTSISNIQKNLKIVDSTKFINELIKSRLTFANSIQH